MFSTPSLIAGATPHQFSPREDVAIKKDVAASADTPSKVAQWSPDIDRGLSCSLEDEINRTRDEAEYLNNYASSGYRGNDSTVLDITEANCGLDRPCLPQLSSQMTLRENMSAELQPYDAKFSGIRQQWPVATPNNPANYFNELGFESYSAQQASAGVQISSAQDPINYIDQRNAYTTIEFSPHANFLPYPQQNLEFPFDLFSYAACSTAGDNKLSETELCPSITYSPRSPHPNPRQPHASSVDGEIKPNSGAQWSTTEFKDNSLRSQPIKRVKPSRPRQMRFKRLNLSQQWIVAHSHLVPSATLTSDVESASGFFRRSVSSFEKNPTRELLTNASYDYDRMLRLASYIYLWKGMMKKDIEIQYGVSYEILLDTSRLLQAKGVGIYTKDRTLYTSKRLQKLKRTIEWEKRLKVIICT